MSIQFTKARTLIATVLLVTFSFPMGAAETDKADLARRAQQVLKANCYGCHGQEGAVEGGVNYILDLTKLVSRKKVIPGDPAKSRLYKRLTSRNDPMPPPEVKARPSKEDLEVIKQWIDAGSPDLQDATVKRELVTDADLLRYMLTDLQDIDPESRPFTRYFTLAHLFNANLSEDELQTYRHGLSKLVNSLSWSSDIKIPAPVDPLKTLFRIDLRDYKWDAGIWKGILDQNPYGILYATATARAIRAATGCELPYVRADWFVFAASRSPLYHDILQLPKTDKALEDALQVDVEGNLKEEKVVRAAFNGSGVSRSNRLIERHPSRYGAYWKSYDFATNTGRQNLFEHPLGPAREETAFLQDGGEIIFHLPNGLQAYMLIDGKGNRINEGPTKIVSVKNKPDPTVINGVSCMACHARGLIEKADQIRAHVDKNPTAFSKEDASTIKALYAPEPEFKSLLQEDSQRFCKAASATGVRLGDTEPVAALAARFESELDLALASAEAGLSTEHLLQAVDHVAALGRRLGPLKIEGGTVQRTVFVEAFDDLIGALRMGSSLKILNRALADANEAILANPKIAAPYCDRADIRLDKGEFDLAVTDYTHAIELEPNTFRAYFHRALANAAKGDFDKALDDYGRALRLEPGNADAYHNRSLAYARLEKLDSALADLTEAIRLDRTNATLVSDRGLIHIKRGEFDQG
ncbi:MAG TPA: tetratricopeptide repeat protein, partial [Gemmataceae bacterium]|nr:tetratricopeptide repeat protein [Gemmataceae bacterium]